LTFRGGAGDVATCEITSESRALSLKGFAGVGLSDNAGSDWADVTFGEHAIVNFAEPPSATRAPNNRGSPVGLPIFITGRHFGGARDAPGDGGNRPPFACAFDGRAAPTALDENGGVSSALHRCEVPPRTTSDEKQSDARRTAAVLPPGFAAADDENARAAWFDVPWARAGAVTVNGVSLKLLQSPFSSRETGRDVFVTHERAARFEDGGDAFVIELVSDDDDDDDYGQLVNDAERSLTAHAAVGCAFGATRVEGRAEGDHRKGAVFCASPAAKRPGVRNTGQGAFFGVGARFAERMTVQLRGGGTTADATRDAGRAFAAIVGRRGSLDVSSLGGSNALRRTCAVAIGDSGGYVSGSSTPPLPRFPFFCDTPIVAAERAGFVAVRASLGAEFFDGAWKSLGQISARAAPAARGAAPSAAAAGGESVNVPVFVTGKDLPGAGETAWCVARGGAFGAAAEEDTSATKTRRLSAAFVPAIPVSSALVLCPPPEAGGVVSGDFSSSPARLEIVPVDVAAGTPTGGAFYAKSSVEMDVEAHGGGPPGAAGEMEVGGGGGGAAPFFVPEEGGATVFVRPGAGGRVAPSACDFGTIVGVAARHAHKEARMDEKEKTSFGRRWRNLRFRTRMVRVRFAGDARAPRRPDARGVSQPLAARRRRRRPRLGSKDLRRVTARRRRSGRGLRDAHLDATRVAGGGDARRRVADVDFFGRRRIPARRRRVLRLRGGSRRGVRGATRRRARRLRDLRDAGQVRDPSRAFVKRGGSETTPGRRARRRRGVERRKLVFVSASKRGLDGSRGRRPVRVGRGARGFRVIAARREPRRAALWFPCTAPG
jgi:hypothetical protein